MSTTHFFSFSAASRRFIMAVCMVVAVATLGEKYLLVGPLNPEVWYTYINTEGPFRGTMQGNTCLADRSAGPISSVRPGDTIGWITNVTIEPGVATESTLVVRRISDKHVVASRDQNREGNVLRYGPVAMCIEMPQDAPDGDYEIKRHTTFIPPHGSPSAKDFPSLFIGVKKP